MVEPVEKKASSKACGRGGFIVVDTLDHIQKIICCANRIASFEEARLETSFKEREAAAKRAKEMREKLAEKKYARDILQERRENPDTLKERQMSE